MRERGVRLKNSSTHITALKPHPMNEIEGSQQRRVPGEGQDMPGWSTNGQHTRVQGEGVQPGKVYQRRIFMMKDRMPQARPSKPWKLSEALPCLAVPRLVIKAVEFVQVYV